jgi:hypothetical protein
MVLDVLSLYIPGVVEVDQLEKAAALLARVANVGRCRRLLKIHRFPHRS